MVGQVGQHHIGVEKLERCGHIGPFVQTARIERQRQFLCHHAFAIVALVVGLCAGGQHDARQEQHQHQSAGKRSAGHKAMKMSEKLVAGTQTTGFPPFAYKFTTMQRMGQ